MSIWTILLIVAFVAMMATHMRGGGHTGHGCHGGGHADPRRGEEPHEHGRDDVQARGEFAQPPASSPPPDRELVGGSAGHSHTGHRHGS